MLGNTDDGTSARLSPGKFYTALVVVSVAACALTRARSREFRSQHPFLLLLAAHARDEAPQVAGRLEKRRTTNPLPSSDKLE